MTFKKETEKIMLLQMKGLVNFYHPPVILFERDTKYCSVLFSNTLERNELKVCISLKENKLVWFRNS